MLFNQDSYSYQPHINIAIAYSIRDGFHNCRNFILNDQLFFRKEDQSALFRSAGKRYKLFAVVFFHVCVCSTLVVAHVGLLVIFWRCFSIEKYSQMVHIVMGVHHNVHVIR